MFLTRNFPESLHLVGEAMWWGWLRRLFVGLVAEAMCWVGEINIKAKLSPAELKLGLSLAKYLLLDINAELFRPIT